MEIISRRERKTHTNYFRQFTWRDNPGAGFCFDCDENGNMVELNPDAQRNYDACRSEYDVIDNGVQSSTNSWVEAAVGRCGCGQTVELYDPLDNECEGCGTCYNMSGQRVTPSWKCDSNGEPYDDY